MPRYFAIVPAAGWGSRMKWLDQNIPSYANLPKQYWPLLGVPMLKRTVDCLATHASITKIFVVLKSDDQIAKTMATWPQYVELLFCGGATRRDTVLNALFHIETQVHDDDWILVHDAARPGLSKNLLDRLIIKLSEDAVGGLLASPLADTLKQVDQNMRSIKTIAREQLWQAQTPQMFRYCLLRSALQKMADATDEASAIEKMGLQPLIVESESSNFKVTTVLDYALMEAFIKTIANDSR